MQRSRLTTRLARAAGLAVAAALLTAGCAAADAGPQAAVSSLSGIGPITFATGKVDTSYLPGLLAEWNAAHPGQRVTLIQLPDDADDQHAQMVANLQTGSGTYDVLNLDVIWTAEFASNGWIVPISPRLVPLSDFLPPGRRHGQVPGQAVRHSLHQ